MRRHRGEWRTFASRGATPTLRTGNLDKVLVLMLFMNV